MINLLPLTTYLFLFLLTIHGASGEDWPVLNASLVPSDKRDYNIRDNYCRLLAHTSLLIRDPRNGHLTIVIDGGMAKYKVQVERKRMINSNTSKLETDWEVPDLNGDTAIIGLDVGFTLADANKRIQIIPKPQINGVYVPAVNRGYMWTDSNSNIYISGGHFFEQDYWSESAYYVQKRNIPDFSIWRYSISQDKWTELFLDRSGSSMIRLISSAATSIPRTNLSYAYAGYLSPRSGRDNANGNWSTNGLVIYDHGTNKALNISQPEALNQPGYTHGALHHIGPFGNHKGLLLVLMAKEYPLNLNFIENEPTQGKSYDFTEIRFYNLETNEWYTQQADFISGQKPTTRTRFCSVLVREEGTQTWDLWLYGGQGTDDVQNNPNDIWVLTMPAFMWVKIPHSFESIYTRGHTCHAVGSQMIVLGGYPPSEVVDPKAPCDSNFVKIFDMTQKSWTGEFKTNSTYKQPTGNNGLDRWRNSQPIRGWGDPVLQSFLTQTPDPPPPPPTITQTVVPNPQASSKTAELSIGAIIGVSVAGLIGLVLTGAFIYWCFWVYVPMRRRKEENEEDQRRAGSVFSGSVISGSGAGHPRWGKHELDVANDSHSSTTRPHMSVVSPIIPEPDKGVRHSPSPGIEIRHPAPWEIPDQLGPISHTPPPTTPVPLVPPAPALTSAKLFHELGKGENNTPGPSRVQKRPGSV